MGHYFDRKLVQEYQISSSKQMKCECMETTQIYKTKQKRDIFGVVPCFMMEQKKKNYHFALLSFNFQVRKSLLNRNKRLTFFYLVSLQLKRSQSMEKYVLFSLFQFRNDELMMCQKGRFVLVTSQKIRKSVPN